MGNPSYAGGPGNTAVAACIFRGLRGPWPPLLCGRFSSLLGALPSFKGEVSGQLTDLYLLSLAVRNGARFLILARRIDPSLVPEEPQPTCSFENKKQRS